VWHITGDMWVLVSIDYNARSTTLEAIRILKMTKFNIIYIR